MSDLARWKVHGPVKMLRSEFAEWDIDRQDWQPVRNFNVAEFRADGALLTHDAHNPDGSIAHSQWSYDDAGGMIESISWMTNGPVYRTVYVYDEGGRLIRAAQIAPDGTQTDLEVLTYDGDGKKTKVRFLPHSETDPECNTTNACRAETGYSIEGTDSAYSASGAATMTITYDENSLPAKVSFHDANHHSLSYVILRRDSAGRLLSEELRQGGKSPLQSYLDKAPPEERERLAVLFQVALGDMISETRYEYDAKGRLVKREHRMGNLGGDSTSYRYKDTDDPLEEMIEHRSREASFDETGSVRYSSDQVNVQHNRLEYLYDTHGNSIERIVSFRFESGPDFQRSNVERRVITYYSTS